MTQKNAVKKGLKKLLLHTLYIYIYCSLDNKVTFEFLGVFHNKMANDSKSDDSKSETDVMETQNQECYRRRIQLFIEELSNPGVFEFPNNQSTRTTISLLRICLPHVNWDSLPTNTTTTLELQQRLIQVDHTTFIDYDELLLCAVMFQDWAITNLNADNARSVQELIFAIIPKCIRRNCPCGCSQQVMN